MAIQLIPAIVGAVGWFTALPDWAKYIIFLSGLAVDSGIETLTGYGFFSVIIGNLFNSIFGLQYFVIYSWQLLIIATILPVLLYILTQQFSD